LLVPRNAQLTNQPGTPSIKRPILAWFSDASSEVHSMGTYSVPSYAPVIRT
jgi:hypothetical protein